MMLTGFATVISSESVKGSKIEFTNFCRVMGVRYPSSSVFLFSSSHCLGHLYVNGLSILTASAKDFILIYTRTQQIIPPS